MQVKNNILVFRHPVKRLFISVYNFIGRSAAAYRYAGYLFSGKVNDRLIR